MGERKNNKKSFLYRLGAFFASARARFLEGFYSVHVKVRYLHDKTYQKGGAYKKWTDKPYSNTVHKTALWGFILSFALTSLFQSLWPYLFNPTKPRTVYAGANSVTWTTKADFENNAVTTGGATSRIQTEANAQNSIVLKSKRANVISNDGYGSMAVRNDNTAYCTGGAAWLNVCKPWLYGASLTDVREVSASTNESFIKTDGSQVVYGQSFGNASYPGYTDVVEFATFGSSYAALKGDGTIVGAGDNGYGQLNFGAWTDIVDIDGSFQDFYGVKSDGTVLAVGNNYWGQNNSLSAWTNIVAIESFYNTIVGLKNDGTVVVSSPNTFDVSSWQGIVDVAANAYTIAGLKGDGTVVAVGGNTYGQIDAISSWQNVVDITGGAVILGLKSDGTAYGAKAWGDDYGAYNVSGWTDVKMPFRYSSSGTISGLKIDSGVGIKSDWSSISWNASVPVNTAIKFRTRGAETEEDLAGATWSDLSSGSQITTGPSRWLEVEATLETTNEEATVTLNDFTVNYNTVDAPSSVVSFKSDNTEINPANTNNYTSESAVTVKGTISGIATDDVLTPQFEVRTDTSFTGSPTAPAGVTATGQNDTYLGSPLVGATLGIISGLSPGNTYYYKVRLTDQAGRVSAWSAQNTFSVEQTAPTISSFTIGGDNVQNGFAKLTSVTLNVSASDTGGSTLSKMRFSNDGVFDPGDVNEAWVSYDSSYAWTLTGGDGQKTVYAQVKDAAGNISGTVGDKAQADFNNGTTGLTRVGSDGVVLTGTPTTVTFSPTQDGDVWTSSSPGANWSNTTSSIRYTPNGPVISYSIFKFDVSSIPAGANIDSATFSAYITGGGPLEGTDSHVGAFGSTYAPSSSFYNNDIQDVSEDYGYQDGAEWDEWGVETRITDAVTNLGGMAVFQLRVVNGYGMWWAAFSENSNESIRPKLIVTYSNAGPDYNTNGVFTSRTFDNGAGRNYGALNWGATIPEEIGASALKFRVAAKDADSGWQDSDFVGPNGTTNEGDYYTSSGGQIWSGHNGKRYIKYRAYLATADVGYSPILHDVSIEVNTTNSAQITLDTQAPAAFSLTSPANNTWQQSATPTLTWNASSDPDPDGEGPAEPSGISKYQIYVCSVSPLPSPCPAESFVLNRDNISPTETTVSATPSPALTQRKHTWKIRAFDTAGNYTDSTESWNLGYDAQPPSKALDPGFSLTATDSQSDRITVSWSPPYADDSGNGSPAASYSLERITYSDYAGGVGLPEGQTHTTTSDWSLATSSYTDLGTKSSPFDQTTLSGAIQASVKYIYRIKVTDAAGNISGWLVTDTGLTADTQAPNPPSNTVADACDGEGVYDSGSNPTGKCSNVGNEGFEIKLSWTAATDTGTGVTGYKVYRKYGSNSYNENDFSLVGYKDVDPPGSPIDTVYFDNDSNNDATFSDDINGEIVNIKNASTSRLIDSEVYFYRIVAIDDAGQENDVILIGNDNYATATTPDVTNPTPSSEVVATAMGIDGLPVPPNEDPKQKIAVTWNASTDLRAGGRIPAGNGSGIKYYSIYYATSSGHLDPVDSSTIQNWNLIASDIAPTTPTVSYPHNQLLEMTWYYYKIVAEDKSEGQSQGRLSGDAYSEPVKTLSSQVPTTPSEVSVVAAKGNPATDANVGRKVTVSFKSSYIKFSTNKITGFEVYRATTNWNSINDWLDPQKTTKLSLAEFENLNITGLDIIPEDIQDTLTVYSFIDTVPADSATYYYKVRATGYNPTNNPTTVISGLSQISTGVIGEGWDVVPDATAPDLPSELKVKDIHGDGVNYLRNIITWSRIVTPTRNGQNDFKEYRLYRSNDGLVWTQVLVNGNNPLYNANKELALATNYYIDLIANADSNQYYYYYITAVDDAATEFKYPQPAGAAVINSFANESAPVLDGEGKVVSVSLNPAIAQPSITTLPSGKKGALQSVGVSSAVITWTTDQPCDSLVEYRKTGTSEKFIAAGDTELRNNHTVTLKALDPMTTYEYRILSRNYLANTARAEGNDVPTLATNGFTITPGEVKTTTSTTEIAWSTNLDASSAFVEYQLQRQPGDTAQSGTAGVSLEQLAANAKSHNVVIKGLRSNRTYTYKIKSISTDGFLAETGFLTFKSRSFDSDQFTLTPSSSNVAERNITATTAQIVWQTSMQTTSWVDYSTRSGTYDMSAGNNDLNTQHAVVIEGLVPGTKYFYRVRVKDSNEVEYTSQEYTFTAVLKPKISNLRVSEVTPYSVVIEWETNVETETILNWGKTAGYGEKRGKNEMVKLHKIKVDGLEDNTEYHYQILAKDSNGNEVADDDKIIRTPVDTEGPKIIDVKTDILPMGEADETATVIITWKTNKPATTQVLYDEGIVGNKMSDSTTEDLSLNLSHSVIIRDLTAGSTYRFRVVSADKRGNKTTSNDFNFMTPSKEKSILQLIVKSLEETFGWVKNVGQFFSKLGKKTK